jgi:hypothetical protein
MIQETKKISKRTKLYEELEKKFIDENEKESEAKRLEKLKEIKALRQPVRQDEIINHAKKYEEVLRQKREELRQKRGGLNIDLPPLQ